MLYVIVAVMSVRVRRTSSYPAWSVMRQKVMVQMYNRERAYFFEPGKVDLVSFELRPNNQLRRPIVRPPNQSANYTKTQSFIRAVKSR